MRLLMGDRLVCQSCSAILLEQEDLEDAVDDLTSDLPQLVDEGVIETGCPRCAQRLRRAGLLIGRKSFGHELLRCVDHGVWFEAAQLVELFEWLSRSSHAGAARGGKYYGGVGDVLIVHGRRPKAKPRAPVFERTYERLACPACARALTYAAGRWDCGGCRGVFVEERALATMMTSMTGDPWDPPAPTTAAEGARPCPVCTAGMIEEELLGVPIDRCPGHGVWFDHEELETALHNTTQPGQGGFRRWLRSLLS